MPGMDNGLLTGRHGKVKLIIWIKTMIMMVNNDLIKMSTRCRFPQLPHKQPDQGRQEQEIDRAYQAEVCKGGGAGRPWCRPILIIAQ